MLLLNIVLIVRAGHNGDDDDDEDDEIIYEVKCPTCDEVINLDEHMLEMGGIKCPNCGEELEFDAIDDEEE